MPDDLHLTLYPGNTSDGSPVVIEVTFEHRRLSITGTTGGSCGQIADVLTDLTPAPGWTLEMLYELTRVWDTWHLNDMQAGTPAQTAEVNRYRIDHPAATYEAVQAHLRGAGLDPDPSVDPPYRYGSGWLMVDVPGEVLSWLADLPTAKPAEVETAQASHTVEYLTGIYGMSPEDADAVAGEICGDVEEEFRGVFESPAEYARDFAEDAGLVKADDQWPYTCIDWEGAASALDETFIVLSTGDVAVVLP